MENTYHHKNLKEELIEEGIKIINKHGFEQLSMRKLANVCNVSPTAAYRHFQDKDDLLAKMQMYVETQFSEILKIALHKNKDNPNRMTEFGKAYVLFFFEHPEYYSFFTRQQGIHVSFHQKDAPTSDYLPFKIYQDAATSFLNENNVPSAKQNLLLITMWSTVHGLAGMATMPGVTYDGDWAILTESVLKGI